MIPELASRSSENKINHFTQFPVRRPLRGGIPELAARSLEEKKREAPHSLSSGKAADDQMCPEGNFAPTREELENIFIILGSTPSPLIPQRLGGEQNRPDVRSLALGPPPIETPEKVSFMASKIPVIPRGMEGSRLQKAPIVFAA